MSGLLRGETTPASPIGVFDSGLGGISVLKELRAQLPYEDIFYYGDSARAPYGVKSKDEVLSLSRANVELLLDHGAKAVVIACNTATSAAVEELRHAYPRLPIIGMEPALKPAALSGDHPTVLVLATEMTLAEEKFARLLDQYRRQAQVWTLAAPGLVDLVERGIVFGPKLDEYLEQLLSPWQAQPPDSLVLGCTHFPLVREAISRALGAKVKIFDGAEGTARETKRRLAAANLLHPGPGPGRVEIANSSPDLVALSYRLLDL